MRVLKLNIILFFLPSASSSSNRFETRKVYVCPKMDKLLLSAMSVIAMVMVENFKYISIDIDFLSFFISLYLCVLVVWGGQMVWKLVVSFKRSQSRHP